MDFNLNKKNKFNKRERLLSHNELSFYSMLREATNGDIIICPKVCLYDIFMNNTKEDGENYKDLCKISKKPLDFLLCSSHDLRPILGIELEKSYYLRKNRMKKHRDLINLFSETNLPLIRFENKSTYKLNDIKERLNLILINSEKSMDVIEAAIDIENLDSRDKKIRRKKQDKLLCPSCGALMIVKKTRRGPNKGKKFLGCSNYPQCKEIIIKNKHCKKC